MAHPVSIGRGVRPIELGKAGEKSIRHMMRSISQTLSDLLRGGDDKDDDRRGVRRAGQTGRVGEGKAKVRGREALLQPTTYFHITLANGTTVVGALGGNLDLHTQCPLQAFYTSEVKAQEASPFLQQLQPFVVLARSSMYCVLFLPTGFIFDFANVEIIHETFFDALPRTH
ncbi:hypothetical protein B0H14DRAFT_3133183 [Mycena olivaceomarginata]|nr:hypothetical protein B0H14DRAFT_3133183 [Mycena olivaceomarginata]